jgi:hypothetical protein
MGFSSKKYLDYVHMGLDAAGFVPGLGAAPDLLNAVICFEAGKYATTETVAKNLSTRPYINSPSTIC